MEKQVQSQPILQQLLNSKRKGNLSISNQPKSKLIRIDNPSVSSTRATETHSSPSTTAISPFVTTQQPPPTIPSSSPSLLTTAKTPTKPLFITIPFAPPPLATRRHQARAPSQPTLTSSTPLQQAPPANTPFQEQVKTVSHTKKPQIIHILNDGEDADDFIETDMNIIYNKIERYTHNDDETDNFIQDLVNGTNSNLLNINNTYNHLESISILSPPPPVSYPSTSTSNLFNQPQTQGKVTPQQQPSSFITNLLLCSE